MTNTLKMSCPSISVNAQKTIIDDQEKYYSPQVEVHIRPECSVLAPDDVVIEPIFNGVCGTDISLLKTQDNGEIGFQGPAKLPVVIGHEYTGMVIAVGSNSRFNPGDYVASESIESCGQCQQCESGHLNQCLNVEILGLTKDGALSNSIRVKDRHVYSIQKLVDRFGLNKALEIGTLLEPAGCSYNAIMIDPQGNTVSKVLPGSHVVVFGCGPIGLLNIALAKAQGAGSIVAFDLVPAKVELALKIGATAAFVVDGALETNYLRATNGQKANVVLEASGSPQAMESALSLVAPRGVILLQGRMPTSVISIDPNFLVSEAISIIGVRGHAGYRIFEDLINWFSENPFDFEELFHQKRFSFFQAKEAIDLAKTQPGKVLCVNPKYIKKLAVNLQ